MRLPLTPSTPTGHRVRGRAAAPSRVGSGTLRQEGRDRGPPEAQVGGASHPCGLLWVPGTQRASPLGLGGTPGAPSWP